MADKVVCKADSAANTHSAEAVLRISSDSSCIFSAASHASVLLGDAKNDVVSFLHRKCCDIVG